MRGLLPPFAPALPIRQYGFAARERWIITGRSKMKKSVRVFAFLLAALMLLSLCGCGSAKHSASNTAAREDAAYGASYEFENYAAAEMVADGDYGLAPVPMPSSAAGAGKESDVPDEDPEKIIYAADVTVETTTFDESVTGVNELVERYDGWIESSSISGSNYYQKAKGTASTRDASFTLRIPSRRFNEMMESLSALGNIPYSHIYTENVTSQYVDTQARLKAYTTQEARLLEMMELAETVEDVIIIEDRLTELRYQIEALQSTLNNWDRRVSYSTISLTVKEVREYTPEIKEEPSYWEELKEALKEGVSNAGEILKGLLVFLIEILPVIIILIPVIWLLVWLVKKVFHLNGEKAARRRAARAARKAEKKAAKDAAKNPAAVPEIPAAAQNESPEAEDKPESMEDHS